MKVTIRGLVAGELVCVRVTLNDDPHQHSGGCVRFTYFDE